MLLSWPVYKKFYAVVRIRIQFTQAVKQNKQHKINWQTVLLYSSVSFACKKSMENLLYSIKVKCFQFHMIFNRNIKACVCYKELTYVNTSISGVGESVQC